MAIEFNEHHFKSFEIAGLDGRSIQKGSISWDSLLTLNIEDFPNGLYFIILKGKRNETVKFIKY